MLLRRGAPSSTIDDALQIAAERALRRAEPFDNLQGWTNWTIKVAWHEVQAQWRRMSRSVPGEVPERTAGDDPAIVVEDRLALMAVVDALPQLNPAVRQTILSLVEDRLSPGGTLTASDRMRRYRARRRLAALLSHWEPP